MTFDFKLVEKAAIDEVLTGLFKILYDNMILIAPTGVTFEEDFAVWREYIVPAMQEEHRQIVQMFCEDELAGYFQYDIREASFMMEEIQIKPQYQGTGLFRELYRWLEKKLPAGLVSVEAYANKNNLKSQKILEHLGLRRTGENKSGSSYHYEGGFGELWECLRQGG